MERCAQHHGIPSSIIDAFLARIEAQALSFDTVAGTATAGIPHAAWIADHLEKPMVYVRGTAKAHGKGRLIEGVVEPGQRVLVVEDLISTAKSALHAVQALREEGAKVHDVLAVFSYGLPQAQAHCREASVACHALSCFEVLLDAAVEQSYLSPNEAESVATWAQDPLAWGKAWREAQA